MDESSKELPPERVARPWIRSEDWLAVLLGGFILTVVLTATAASRSAAFTSQLTEIDQRLAGLKDKESLKVTGVDSKAETEQIEELRSKLYRNPFKAYVAKVGSWQDQPQDAFFVKGRSTATGIAGVFVWCLFLFGLGAFLRGASVPQFLGAFIGVFFLAVLSFVLANQTVIKYYNLEYAIWALVTGMLISNSLGTPAFLRAAMLTELYIKTGLILLGAEVLLSRLVALGLPGICVSWIVTPVVLIGTYLFGQHVLRIPSRSLNMVISADMSVCGVSAAIATAAACRAKKEELSLAIGISLAFTAVMMVVMPIAIRFMGLSPVVAGAWLGGTIDSTGAVAAAGKMMGEAALQVAVTVKMIQNILIGVVAFGVAVYWVTFVERNDAGPRPSIMEIWYRFPKFVLGFIGASVAFSIIASNGTAGTALVEAVTGGTTETLRTWFFCLAFVAIGLETNFWELSQYLKDGKAVVLYVCGQTLNLVLTLLMAWLMFEVVFPQTAAVLG